MVIVGAGWIGLEVAAAAREDGCEVTVVEPEPTALHRALGPELGEVFADLHREHGVEFRFGERCSELRGPGGRVGEVHHLVGRRRCPPTSWWSGSARCPTRAWPRRRPGGRQRGRGPTRRCAPPTRTSSPPVTWPTAYHPLLGRRVRVEHWANALNGGPAAARSMLGQDVAYDRVPYFYSDQYDLGMETSGLPEPGNYDEVVYRGDRPGREFIAFWLAGGRGGGRHERQRLGRHRRHPGADPVREEGGPARLTDPDIPIAEV